MFRGKTFVWQKCGRGVVNLFPGNMQKKTKVCHDQNCKVYHTFTTVLPQKGLPRKGLPRKGLPQHLAPYFCAFCNSPGTGLPHRLPQGLPQSLPPHFFLQKNGNHKTGKVPCILGPWVPLTPASRP